MPMKLRYSPTSPYVRKVLVTALECGLEDRIERVVTNAWAPDTDLVQDNPLSKVPALVTEGGEVLFDSPVICEYLDSLHGGKKLFPASGGARWNQLRLHALGDGILDAAVQVRIETFIRPEPYRWTGWVERQSAAIIRATDALEQECEAWGDDFLAGQIAVACGLDYVDFRAVVEWRAGHPRLAAWLDRQLARPSMAATRPPEG